MMTIKYTGTNLNVSNAVTAANNLWNDPAFYNLISAHPGFTFSDATPKEVAGALQTSTFDLTIDIYRPLNPLSRANAYDDPQHPLVIHLNTYKLNRSVASIAATMIHECVHAADAMCQQYYFHHGDNSPVGKEDSAPYWIDNLAYEMLSGNTAKVIFQSDDMSNDKV